MELEEFAELLEIGLPKELVVRISKPNVVVSCLNKGLELDPSQILDNVSESSLGAIIKIITAVFRRNGLCQVH